MPGDVPDPASSDNADGGSPDASPLAKPRGVRVELARIVVSDLQDQQLILLKEVDGTRRFPIVIGSNEADAINRRLGGMTSPRPFTHDLLAAVVETLGGRVERIEIHDLEAHTFFARVVLRRENRWFEVDSRPSDAIALGVATDVAIYVAEHVLDEVAS